MSEDLSARPRILLMGQTPPPWHGQAVATQILFEHDWPGFEVECLRMDFSSEMSEVGRLQFKKVLALIKLIFKARRSLSRSPGSILFYPPSSANWIPFIRDVIFLTSVRGKATGTVFIFHASGLADFTHTNWLKRFLAKMAYGHADMALEVAEEHTPPHRTFHAKDHQWCPCGIHAPPMPPKSPRNPSDPLQVLFVGSLQEGKGILEILRTAAHLREKGLRDAFHFKIVGRWMDETFERETMKLHHELQLEHMVTFSGQLTGAAKWQAYHDADVFFFPSHYPSEASPIVLMEALAAGLPVVSTLWNGIPALMKGCSTARLLPVHSPADYAAALCEIRDSRDGLPAMAIQSREFYEQNFLPERFVRRVEDALMKVAELIRI